jgi:hypothetical protein
MAESLVRRVEAGTPPHRDRAVDVLRALAICGVVLGHWMVTGFASGSAGLHTDSPLRHLPFLTPATWVAQTLALFFFAGGYANAAGSGGSGHTGGAAYRSWLGTRLRRLTSPVRWLPVLWVPLLAAMAVAGAGHGTVRTAAMLVASPLWFLAVYLVLTAATPLVAAAVRRFGAAAALAPLLVAAVVDLLRFGPPAVPSAVPSAGTLNVLACWLVPYTLGVAHARGRLTGRRAGAALAVAGAAGAAVLVALAGYPASMVGVPGAGRSNLDPPSLLVPALAAIQVGLALLCKDRLSAAARRPALWCAVALLNTSAMTVFLWHQSVLLLAVLAGRAAGDPLPGLVGTPDGLGWVAARAALLPVLAAALAGLVTAPRVLGRGRGGPGAAQPAHSSRTDSASAAPCA